MPFRLSCLVPNARPAILSASSAFCTGFFRWLPSFVLGFVSLYHVKARPLATNFQLAAAYLAADEDVMLTRICSLSLRPRGPASSRAVGLLSVRHVEISSLDDLSKVRVTGKRLWARISDPSTGKRRLCATSKLLLVVSGSSGACDLSSTDLWRCPGGLRRWS